MNHAESFKDLVVYQKARGVAKEVFQVTKSFPKEEMYSLTDQVRRSLVQLALKLLKHGGNGDMKNILLAS